MSRITKKLDVGVLGYLFPGCMVVSVVSQVNGCPTSARSAYAPQHGCYMSITRDHAQHPPKVDSCCLSRSFLLSWMLATVAAIFDSSCPTGALPHTPHERGQSVRIALQQLPPPAMNTMRCPYTVSKHAGRHLPGGPELTRVFCDL